MSKKIIAWGALAGSITAILGLWFLLFPNKKPQADPNEFGATLKVVSVEPNISLDTEIGRIEIARSGGLAETRKKYGGYNGAVIFFECTVKGKQDTKYPLRWTLHDATTRTALREFTYQAAWPTPQIIQKGTAAQLAGDIWVPYPKRAGSFYVKLEIIDPDTRRAMAYAESSAFDVP